MEATKCLFSAAQGFEGGVLGGNGRDDARCRAVRDAGPAVPGP